MRSARLSATVYAEQVRTTYVHLPLTLCVSVLNSLLAAFVLISVVAESKVIAWLSLVVVLSALRFVGWRAYMHLDIGLPDRPFWTHFLTAGSCASGLLWGCTIFLFSPLDDPHVFFLALVIAGMCAGAATVHAAHFPSVIAFILPSILPLTTNLLLENSRLHIASGVMAGRLRSIVVSRKPTVPDVVP